MRDLEQEYNPKTSDILRRILHPGHHLKSEIEIEMLRIFESLPPKDQININGILAYLVSEVDGLGWVGAWSILCKGSVFEGNGRSLKL